MACSRRRRWPVRDTAASRIKRPVLSGQIWRAELIVGGKLEREGFALLELSLTCGKQQQAAPEATLQPKHAGAVPGAVGGLKFHGCAGVLTQQAAQARPFFLVLLMKDRSGKPQLGTCVRFHHPACDHVRRLLWRGTCSRLREGQAEQRHRKRRSYNQPNPSDGIVHGRLRAGIIALHKRKESLLRQGQLQARTTPQAAGQKKKGLDFSRPSRVV